MEKIKNKFSFNSNIKFDKTDIEQVVQVLLFFIVILQSLQKGGFYIYDMQFTSVALIAVSIFFVIYKITKKEIKFDLSHLFLILLVIFYLLPIIFDKSPNVNYALWEAIKYLDLYCIYFIVTNTKNKKIYEYLIIFVGILIRDLWN